MRESAPLFWLRIHIIRGLILAHDLGQPCAICVVKDEASPHFDWDAEEGAFDIAQEVPVLVPRGATLCWHGAALHASRANTSDRWRRAWAVHFLADGASKEGRPSPGRVCH